MQLIVKPEILDKCSGFLDYKGVDLDNKNTMVKPKNMNIGFGARSLLTELRRKNKVQSSDFAEFFTNALLFIVTIIKKLLKNSPATSNVVKNTSLFDPCVLASEKSELLLRKMSALRTHQMKLKILSSVQCDKINGEFVESLDELRINVYIFQNFSFYETALDDFFFKSVGLGEIQRSLFPYQDSAFLKLW